jgi:hypothetical protein
MRRIAAELSSGLAMAHNLYRLLFSGAFARVDFLSGRKMIDFHA